MRKALDRAFFELMACAIEHKEMSAASPPMVTVRRGIVSPPNLGQRRQALLQIGGRMPVTRTSPCEWHDTPNVHLCTSTGFENLAAKPGLTSTGRALMADGDLIAVLPALRAALAVYRFETR